MSGSSAGRGDPADSRDIARGTGSVDRRRRYAVGVGLRPQATAGELFGLVGAVLAEHAIPPTAVVALATLDRRADHPAVRALAAAHGWPVIGYTPDELAVSGAPASSPRVHAAVGTPSVAEAAALLAATASKATSSDSVAAEPAAAGAAAAQDTAWHTAAHGRTATSRLIVTKRTIPTAAVAIAAV